VNGKVGMIYRATDDVRVGFSFSTPTWYQISDSFSEALDTRYKRANGTTIEPYTNTPAIYDTDYTLRTPYRVNGGLSAIVNKQGLLTADVEYVDYSSVNFRTDDRVAEQNTNDNIRDNYKAAVNLRVGGEYKINNLMLRAGYNRMGSPFQNRDVASDILSAGIGLRSSIIYVDLTYQNASVNTTNTPYVISKDYADYGATGAGRNSYYKKHPE
jgi:long-subunit fatty acid transport protein